MIFAPNISFIRLPEVSVFFSGGESSLLDDLEYMGIATSLV